MNPPTAAIGAGTVDSNGKPLDPLIRLDWTGAEIDVYAQLDDCMARLFTVAVDLKLPLGVTTDGCSGLTPVVGDLTGAVTEVKNSEILAEPLDDLKKLVPALLPHQLAQPFTPDSAAVVEGGCLFRGRLAKRPRRSRARSW